MAEPGTLSIQLANLPDDRLARLTRELGRDLTSVGVQAHPIEIPPSQGERGDLVVLGTLAIALIESGAVTAAIECLSAYLSRERKLIIRMTRPDGTQIEISGTNIDAGLMRTCLESAVKHRK